MAERLSGLAVVYNSLSEDLGGFRERVLPKAVERTLRDPAADVLALREHHPLFMLGRRRSGTLSLKSEPAGLRAEIQPPTSGTGAETLELVERGDLNAMSFAFRVMEGGESWEVEDGELVRTLSDFTLHDVSIVGVPAYAATSVSARHAAAPAEARSSGAVSASSIVEAVAGRAWAILPDLAEHVRGLVAGSAFASTRSLARLKARAHEGDEAAGAGGRRMVGDVAVLSVVGTMTQRGGSVASAATRSTAALVDELQAAIGDPNVSAIVLEFDTPGGEVYGVPEAWEEIRTAGAVKPIVAHANSYAASAGYYLFSAATEGWVTPSGQVGSIGVYMLHVDRSKRLEREGERWTFISAGRFKVEGNPAEPLSSDARAELQKRVDGYYAEFVRHVAAGRGVSPERVRAGFGEGRMVDAREAVRLGMADRVGTLAQAIERAAQLGRQGAPRSAGRGIPLEILRLRNDLAAS